ncbi:hypothetical protein BJX65DRAFT_90466 [Aspergillus insuetus]
MPSSDAMGACKGVIPYTKIGSRSCKLLQPWELSWPRKIVMGRFSPDAVTKIVRMQQGSDVAGFFLTRPAVCDRVSNESVGCLGGDNVDILSEIKSPARSRTLSVETEASPVRVSPQSLQTAAFRPASPSLVDHVISEEYPQYPIINNYTTAPALASYPGSLSIVRRGRAGPQDPCH